MITEGYVARHYQGRPGGRGPALIDIAQDHLLSYLDSERILALGAVLKGGTAIRKLRAGNAGRFSTDLDFAGLTDDLAEMLLEAVDGATVGPFSFAVEPINGTVRARLHIDSKYGPPEVPARLDLGRRGLWLPTETLAFVTLPIHAQYGFALPPIPTARIEEVVAEKLARYSRGSLARDLYDLQWLARMPFDEMLVRRVTVLKVWGDVNDDRLGDGPFRPEVVTESRRSADFEPEQIGYLTTPVDIDGWVETVKRRYAFLLDLDDVEREMALCRPGDRWKHAELVSALDASRI